MLQINPNHAGARNNLEVLRQEGLRIAVVNFESPSAYLSDYVLEVEKQVVADVIVEGGAGRPLGNHSGDPRCAGVYRMRIITQYASGKLMKKTGPIPLKKP